MIARFLPYLKAHRRQVAWALAPALPADFLPLLACLGIVIIHFGIIAEQGSFVELLRRGGIFADYYQTQFAPEHAAEAGVSVPA